MIEESRTLKERVQWYSSMLGKLASVAVVVARLKEVGVTNWAVACLRAGQKTRRWAVAWSWGGSEAGECEYPGGKSGWDRGELMLMERRMSPGERWR